MDREDNDEMKRLPPPAVEDDLDDLLGPTPLTARQLQQMAKKETLGPGRVKGDKRTPERMARIIDQLAKMPVVGDACKMAGIHRETLKLWLIKSKTGIPGDGFDLPLDPNDPSVGTIRLHEAYDAAMEDGLDLLERAAIQKALGQLEPLTYQGRVIYQLDPRLMGLGLPENECWLLDDKGRPVPESVMKQDPDLMQFILKARRKGVYGNKTEVDVTHRGGVLVVGAKAVTGQSLNEEEAQFRINAVDVEFEEVGDADT